MRKISFLCIFLAIVIVLSGCSEITETSDSIKPDNQQDNNDKSEIIILESKINIDEENCNLVSINHDWLSIENSTHVDLIENVVRDIVLTIDDRSGSPYSMVLGSYNYWYLSFTDSNYKMNVTFYSLDEENTQNYIIVEYVLQDEIVDKLVYSFSSESFNNLLSYIGENNNS